MITVVMFTLKLQVTRPLLYKGELNDLLLSMSNMIIMFLAEVRSLHMTAKLGTFVEYSVFGKETTVDWTIISDMKGIPSILVATVSKAKY